MNRLTLECKYRVISNVDKVYRSAFPIDDMGKIQFNTLALWFPHTQVREDFIIRICGLY